MEQQRRLEALKHQWQQEKYPPQLRHEPWTTRGDVVLRASERPPIQRTEHDAYAGRVNPFRHTSVHASNNGNFGAGVERPDARSHNKWATKRVPGVGKNATEPLSRTDGSTKRGDWLQTAANPSGGRFHNNPLGSGGGGCGVDAVHSSRQPHTAAVSLVDDLPARALSAVASFFDLPSFAAAETTCKRNWGTALHSAGEACSMYTAPPPRDCWICAVPLFNLSVIWVRANTLLGSPTRQARLGSFDAQADSARWQGGLEA